MTNPLLHIEHTADFTTVKPEHIEPAITQLIAENEALLDELLASKATSWDELIRPLELKGDELSRAWSVVSHLHNVVDSDDLREAYNACLPKLSEHATKVGQNQALYQAYKVLDDKAENLSKAQRKAVKDALLDFTLSGVALVDSDKKAYQTLSQELSRLSNEFSQHVMDATDSWEHFIDDKEALKGVPERALAALAQKAQAKGKSGYCLGLDFPSFHAVMTYCDNAQLRELVYRAYTTKASEQVPERPEWDNSPLMVAIVKLRQQKAKLLGFADYAELSLARKMASSKQEVLGFLNDLADKSYEKAQAEMAELASFAKEQFNHTTLEPWDVGYFSEKLKQARFNLSDEVLREYFPAEKVIEGMFTILNKLYGIRFEAIDRKLWHKEAVAFALYDSENNLRAECYMDLYARDKKRGGAWMDECRVCHIKQDGSIQIPIAYLTCNFAPAVAGKPALLSHDEVVTLFHEMGRGRVT